MRKLDLITIYIGSIGGMISYYYHVKRTSDIERKKIIYLFEIMMFVLTAAFFAYISAEMVPDDYEKYKTSIAGLAGLSANETVRFITKEGLVDIIKKFADAYFKRGLK